MKMNRLFTLLLAGSLMFTASCRNDGDAIATPKGAYDNGILIFNEGNFGRPEAEVSFIDHNLNAVTNNVFAAENNGAKLGEVLNSVAFDGDNLYLVVNNSNKIVITNRYTMKKTNEITDQIYQPRAAAVAGNYLYVGNTDAFRTSVYLSIYNKDNYTFVKKIPMEVAAEKVVAVNGNVFVQNASFSTGNKITVINSSTNNVDNTITIPNGSIQKTISHNGSAYVIASGDTDSYIYQYNSTGKLTQTIKLAGIPAARNLDIDQNKFYFSSANKIYTMDINDPKVPTQPIIIATDAGLYFTLYGFSVIDGKVYTSDAKNFTENSVVTVYSTAGKVLKTFTAGMGVNGFYKN